MVSLIFRARLRFEDKFTYTDVLPLAGYGIIAAIDYWISLCSALPRPTMYASLSAATYVSQVTCNLSEVLMACSRPREPGQEFRFAWPGKAEGVVFVLWLILHNALRQFVFHDTYKAMFGGMLGLSIFLLRIAALVYSLGNKFPKVDKKNLPWIVSSCLFFLPLHFLSYRIWDGERCWGVLLVYVLGEIFKMSLFQTVGNLVSLFALLVWSLVLSPIVVHGLPYHVMPQTTARITDLDQMVTFGAIATLVIYRWKRRSWNCSQDASSPRQS